MGLSSKGPGRTVLVGSARLGVLPSAQPGFFEKQSITDTSYKVRRFYLPARAGVKRSSASPGTASG